MFFMQSSSRHGFQYDAGISKGEIQPQYDGGWKQILYIKRKSGELGYKYTETMSNL